MEQLPKRFTRGDAKKQADFEDLNEESEIEDDEDVMSTLSKNEMEVIRVEEKRRKETTKARRKLIHQKQKSTTSGNGRGFEVFWGRFGGGNSSLGCKENC
ncbi:hypothetical protein Tco_0838892 [Tanacetum coccineum]|uniref:Uncharacterized protein n=1 Tax=Tanacetum coccineum TaxID=301880 RepID=A0ABQ5AP50_9ASTR